jgi:carbon-monoxide dehydrogenase iron sulfur subunit
MAKQLVIKPERCMGCRTCELMCSFGHYETFNPRMAAVTVVEYFEDALSIPIMCMQCDDAACAKVCPVGALVREDDGFVSYNPDKCIKCKMCMNACPLGNIHFSPIARRMIKCDLCGGEPMCVRYCSVHAIEIVDDADIPEAKRTAADKLREAYLNEKEAIS